jgi:hypothetical protein
MWAGYTSGGFRTQVESQFNRGPVPILCNLLTLWMIDATERPLAFVAVKMQVVTGRNSYYVPILGFCAAFPAMHPLSV